MRAVDRVKGPLEDECEAIRSLLTHGDREDVRVRHEVGVRLCVIKANTDRYGDHAVERLASALRFPARVLYRCATVAEVWTAEGLDAVMARTNAAGGRLSWSHLVALTRCASSVSRRAILEQCLRESWSVRELSAHVARQVPQTPDSAAHGAHADVPVKVAFAEGIVQASRADASLRVLVRALDAGGDDDAGDAFTLARAIVAVERLTQGATATLARLKELQRAAATVRRAPEPARDGARYRPVPPRGRAVGSSATRSVQ